MKAKLTPNVLALLAIVGIALVAGIGWLALVGPQRSKSADLGEQIAVAEVQIDLAEIAAKSDGDAEKKLAGPNPRALVRAMPDTVQTPRLLRELGRAARLSGVHIDGVTPQAPLPLQGYSAVPLDVTVSGRYFGIQKFLYKLRTQVAATNDKLRADGRLFSVETLGFQPAEGQLPQLTATIRVNAFVYSGGAPATAAPAATDTSTSSTATAAGGTP